MEELGSRGADGDYGGIEEFGVKNPYEGFSDEDWKLHNEMWWFDPEGHPLYRTDESGGHYLDYYDGAYNHVKRVHLLPETQAESPAKDVQQQPGTPTGQVEPQPPTSIPPDVLPTPEA